MDWIWNPKTKGSGIVTCIPQNDPCPNNCPDCFFQSGRSYLEPLDRNLPHIPSRELAHNRIVRINDGNDSNFQRDLVIETAKQFTDYFFNTAIPNDLGSFPGPIVLTINPGKMTDRDYYKLDKIPNNLMFIRIRTNSWNIEKVVLPAISYYLAEDTPIVLTFMAYYTTDILEGDYYEWKKRTLNSYWVLKQEKIDEIMDLFKDNPYIYSCGVKGQHACTFCGNCIREYYNTKERMRSGK